MSTDREKLEALLEEMRKDGLPVQQGGFEVEAIPTGIASFDLSTGIGGIPRQRMTLAFGEEHSGKTLLLLATIAQVQQSGGVAAFIDAEHALTPGFARLLGVDYDTLTISRPKNMNDAYDVAKRFCRSGLFDIVGFDSLVALATLDEIDSSASDSNKRASLAQLHSQELRKLMSTIHPRTAFFAINQMRRDPNPPAWMRGEKWYTPGGQAPKHASSLSILVKKRAAIKAGDVKIGQNIETYLEKNKVGTPFTSAEFQLMFDYGIDLTTSLIDSAIEMNVITRRSSFYFINMVDPETGEETEELRFNGRLALETAIREQEDLRLNVEMQVAARRNYSVEEEA